MEDLDVLLHAVRLRHVSASKVDEILGAVLMDSARCFDAYPSPNLPSLLRHAVEAKAEGVAIPIILPLKIQAFGKTILQGKPKEAIKRQFVLHLLYSFEFLDVLPNSPFVFNPRTLPLQEALKYCHHANHDTTFHYNHRLRQHISKWCPDALSKYHHLSSKLVRYPPAPSKLITLRALSKAIKSCLQDESNDPSGTYAEMLFHKIRATHNSSDVDTMACRAILSTFCSSSPFYTHSALCKDPLVLLQSTIKTWKIRGLRHILLSILPRLMDANEHLTLQNPNKKAARELLASRDLLLVRSLLLSTTACLATTCPATNSLLRATVAKRPGLGAVLLAQRLPDPAVDHLVQFVPELFSPDLLSCLRDRNPAPERLAAADAVLRIAIARGTKDEGANLAAAALNCLVSSFYLVVGPVGVAINVLREEGGEDVTQSCRTSAFRMLEALRKVDGTREAIRTEALAALQQIAAFCKSEALGGVVGLAALRRKAILKDIYDATVRAVHSMGGGMQV